MVGMDSSHAYDLEAYARRVDYCGPLEPSLAVLQDLAKAHATSVPFENLSVLLGHGIDLRAEALEAKLVGQRRGGYCFEQNGLMLGILRQIGFQVTPLAGRVRLESPRSVTPPRTHLFLLVEIDGDRWFFDVGVGGCSLTAPIQWKLDEPQETPHDRRRIIFEEGKYFHQILMGDAWADVYEFTGEPMAEIDREVANWWTSTNQNSKFHKGLMAAIAMPDGTRKGIMNRRFLHRRGAEVLHESTIETSEQLLEVLGSEFGLEFESGTRFGSGDKPWPTN
jgi:N-hydroxyarylamine O-acetyltransferase